MSEDEAASAAAEEEAEEAEAGPVLQHPLPDRAGGTVRYREHDDVYRPHEDSWLLLEAVVEAVLEKDADDRGRGPPFRLLEVGTGTGVVACAAALAAPALEVVACDLARSALRRARANAQLNGVQDRVEVVQADLARGLRMEVFDLVAFNPPYLPTGPEDGVVGPLHAALDGGPDGTSVARPFLQDLSPGGPPVLMVASSLQERPVLEEAAAGAGRSLERVRATKVSFETLEVLRVA